MIKFIAVILLGYAFVSVLDNTTTIDMYKELRQTSPYAHCIAAHEGTANAEQCRYLKLKGE